MSDLVSPFRGERYAARDTLSRLIAPPYDVIDADERARYAALDEHNIVHVMLPEAPPSPPPGASPDDRYRIAAELLASWRAHGVLTRDPQPALYVLAQDFTLPTGERCTRRGVFAAVKAEGYEPRRIRPHERTHAGPKADRLALLRATATNIESIFLLAPDRDRVLASAVAEAAQRQPDATAELNGVGIRLWVMRDVSRFPLPDEPLYIADGHHRYETASAYAQENSKADRILALIVSAQDPGLVVLPTHRVIFGAGREIERVLPRWRDWFEVQPVPAGMDPVKHLAELGNGQTACLLADRSRLIALLLRPGALPDRVPSLAQSEAVRDLDVARIETFVVKEILGASTSTPIVRYVADAQEAIRTVQHGGAAVAVLLNPTRVDQVFAVADAGDVMPPKSTYFVPKVPSGLVLRPLS
ncbi:MAG TPA: DUF1015 domain-containing protein [Gemmatimonadales bacterium]|nr:DUF1015 domain-containing protein [Gemmatimonadales bacterium]